MKKCIWRYIWAKIRADVCLIGFFCGIVLPCLVGIGIGGDAIWKSMSENAKEIVRAGFFYILLGIFGITMFACIVDAFKLYKQAALACRSQDDA